jgi:hypothetical protein
MEGPAGYAPFFPEDPMGGAQVVFKLALSNEQTGALIGKGGSSITTLQRSCGVLIKAAGVGALTRR